MFVENYKGYDIETYTIKFSGRTIYRIKNRIGNYGYTIKEIKDFIDLLIKMS